MNREIKLCSGADECLLPFAHLLSPPARNGAFINAQPLIGDHEVIIYPQRLPEAFTGRTCTVGIVERKKVWRRLIEQHAIGLKVVIKSMYLFAIDLYVAFALAFIKCCLDTIGKAM